MTWYKKQQNKSLVKEAKAYGKMWLSPEGNHIDANSGEHEGVAQKMVNSLGGDSSKMGPGDASKLLLSKGYARLNYDGPLMNVHFTSALTRDQKLTIKDDFEFGEFFMADLDTPSGPRKAQNIYELEQSLNQAVMANLKKSGIIKTASTPYGYWISPTGDTVPVQNYQSHGKDAAIILEKLGERPSGDTFDDRESLLEKGWVTVSYDEQSGLGMFYSPQLPSDSQINTIEKLSTDAALPEWVFGVSLDFPGKLKMFMMNGLKNIGKFLRAEDVTAVKKFGYETKMIKTADGRTKTIKVASKKLDDFFKTPSFMTVNPKNQVGNIAALYDVQRYNMDSYSMKTAISRTSSKITVSTFVNHAFLGSLAFNKYWTFNFEEAEEAINLYNKVNDISESTIEEFVDEEITTTVFWPILKFKLDQIDPDRSTATTIPWVNYSRYYHSDDNPDWRQNIYGNRYPKYHESSYSEEVRRRGIFTD